MQQHHLIIYLFFWFQSAINKVTYQEEIKKKSPTTRNYIKLKQLKSKTTTKLSKAFELEQKQEAQLPAGGTTLKAMFCQQRVWL